jgi:hypothetical protein
MQKLKTPCYSRCAASKSSHLRLCGFQKQPRREQNGMEEIDPSTLLSRPGHNWSMRWFDGGLEDLQLDIVGFLAILGEDAVRKTARLASLSSIFYLPRLMPAPHALLYVERPENVESVRASVTAVHSGNQRDFLSHVTAALL